jgi:hypothetical protein
MYLKVLFGAIRSSMGSNWGLLKTGPIQCVVACHTEKIIFPVKSLSERNKSGCGTFQGSGAIQYNIKQFLQPILTFISLEFLSV